MTRTIHQLDSLTIDKIAAGEVIESPASCIKELVDNALDAEASNIRIDIQLGGRDKIILIDDGKGMSKEDLEIACCRHATSKITSIDDLESLKTLGFRGEALSSIAAISKMTIRSREKDGTQDKVGPGAELTIEGGSTTHIRDVTAPFGTQIAIESLFYNVPARRKFLKSPSQNGLEILKLVKQLAIISPNVSFTLIADGKEVFHVEATSTLQERIKDVLHEPYRTKAVPLTFEKEGLSIAGCVALPECAKKTRSGQMLFVNGRPVTSHVISYTVKGAYSSSLTSDLHPQFVISLVVDPERLDVNVHPQKKEVRFADEEWIRSQLFEAIGFALFASPNTLLPEQQVENLESTYTSSAFDRPNFQTLREHASTTGFSFGYEPEKETRYFHQPLLWKETKDEPPKIHTPSYLHHLTVGRFAVATLSSKYILIDLIHAFSTTIQHHLEGPQNSSLLLTPETIELHPLEMQNIEKKLPWFQSLGFSLSLFGNNTLLVEGIPSYLEHKNGLSYLKELLEEEIAGKELSSEATKTILSHVAIKTHPELRENSISEPLAKQILSNWMAIGAPPCTKAGKRVFIPLEAEKLASFFDKESI